MGTFNFTMLKIARLLFCLGIPIVLAWTNPVPNNVKSINNTLEKQQLTALRMQPNESKQGRDVLPRIVVLIPAYNEENRIRDTLDTYESFLIDKGLSCSIVVVDDGSSDKTVKVVNSFPNNEKIPIKCIKMAKNGGKGAALACGIQAITNECSNDEMESILILTQDADGSGDLMYLDSMIERLMSLVAGEDDIPDWRKPALVIGNRNYNLFTPRGITRWGFQTAVKVIMNDLRVRDSQCGYKLLTLAAAKDLYQDLDIRGWAHDVEVLYRAKLVDMPISEIPIDWFDKDGSKVVESGVARVSLQMLLDVIRVRWAYWSVHAWARSGDF